MATQTVQGTATALSNGTTDTFTFYALTPWMSTAGVAKVRAAVEMTGDTGDCEIAPAYQIADQVESPTPADGCQIGTNWQDGNGIDYQAAYTTIVTGTYGTEKKLFIRFGVRVKNGTQGAIQGCQASIRVDIQE
jgi:hypothetical protein